MDIIFGKFKVSTYQKGWAVKRKHIIQKGKNEGDVTWVDTKYFPTLKQALSRTVDRMMRHEEVEYVNDAESVIDKLEEVDNNIEEFINNLSKAFNPS